MRGAAVLKRRRESALSRRQTDLEQYNRDLTTIGKDEKEMVEKKIHICQSDIKNLLAKL